MHCIILAKKILACKKILNYFLSFYRYTLSQKSGYNETVDPRLYLPMSTTLHCDLYEQIRYLVFTVLHGRIHSQRYENLWKLSKKARTSSINSDITKNLIMSSFYCIKSCLKLVFFSTIL